MSGASAKEPSRADSFCSSSIAAIELEHNESARDGSFADAPDMQGRAEHLRQQHDTDGDAR